MRRGTRCRISEISRELTQLVARHSVQQDALPKLVRLARSDDGNPVLLGQHGHGRRACPRVQAAIGKQGSRTQQYERGSGNDASERREKCIAAGDRMGRQGSQQGFA